MSEKLPSLFGSIGNREDIDTAKSIKLQYTKVPISELTTPKNGYVCMLDRYWYVTNDECVLFYGDSPQCNVDKRVMEYRLEMSHYEIRLIPIAYRKPYPNH